jgi:hypothetical protein
MQHTRIRAYCQSAQTPLPFIPQAYRTAGAPGAVMIAAFIGVAHVSLGPSYPNNGDGPC